MIASEILNSMINEGDTINIDHSSGNEELYIKILNKKERPGRNPKTGEPAIISARRVITFKAGQKLRKKISNILSE